MFYDEAAQLKQAWDRRLGRDVPRYLVERVLLDSSGYLEHADFVGDDPLRVGEIRMARSRLVSAGHAIPSVETISRYHWVDEILDGTVVQCGEDRLTATDRIDQVVTHRVAGVIIFFVLMIVVFQAIFSWAAPLQDAIERLVSVAW